MMLPAASQLPNPFAVQTPEGLSAESMVSLFVDVFADFQLIRNQGHTFLNGPRGSGKSMMFRFLEPDCQQLATGSSLKDLPFFAVHVPIKNTRLNLTEIECLRGSHAEALIAEHYMVLVVLSRCVDALRRANLPEGPDELIELSDFCSTKISALLFAIGYGSPLEDVPECPNLEQLLRWLEDTLHLCMRELSLYLKRIAFPGGDLAYRGSLGNYVDFLCPFIRQLRGLSFLPDGPVYLLLDDADNLSETQTKVLNEWVSTRSTDDVCLKVSTQLRYKTFRTVTGGTISTPHDYDEINISAVYTSQRSRYKGRMYSIIRKRLELYGMDGNPETFFPYDAKQETAIDAIRERYLSQGDEAARGARARDDATRYARPDYIRELNTRRGGRNEYSYSGLDQLIHISSGVIRHFLDSAAEMFAEEQARQPQVSSIAPAIQDQVVRRQADQLFFAEFDKIVVDDAAASEQFNKLGKMRELVGALGRIFFQVLISEASERRVFSVALSDTDEREVIDVLDLGVQYGYFHKSTIGAKKYGGRVPLYILTRRLAPFFSLDPTSFAGYQFITTRALASAMQDSTAFLRQFSKRGKLGQDEDEEQGVLRL